MKIKALALTALLGTFLAGSNAHAWSNWIHGYNKHPVHYPVQTYHYTKPQYVNHHHVKPHYVKPRYIKHYHVQPQYVRPHTVACPYTH